MFTCEIGTHTHTMRWKHVRQCVVNTWWTAEVHWQVSGSVSAVVHGLSSNFQWVWRLTLRRTHISMYGRMGMYIYSKCVSANNNPPSARERVRTRAHGISAFCTDDPRAVQHHQQEYCGSLRTRAACPYRKSHVCALSVPPSRHSVCARSRQPHALLLMNHRITCSPSSFSAVYCPYYQSSSLK